MNVLLALLLFADVTTGLVFRAPLTEKTGTSIAQTVGPSTGTFTGATLTTVAAPAQFNGRTAVVFNGTDNFITFGNLTALNWAGEHSYAMWLKTSATADSFFFCKQNGSFNTGFDHGLTAAGKPLFVLRPVGMNFGPSAGATVNTNTWRHIVVTITFNSGTSYTARLYVDGALTADTGTANWTPTGNASDVELGRRVNTLYYAGALYDVRAYSRALPAADVLELYRWTDCGGTFLQLF